MYVWMEVGVCCGSRLNLAEAAVRVMEMEQGSGLHVQLASEVVVWPLYR